MSIEARLEREVRQLRWLLGALACVTLGAVLASFTGQETVADVVKARRFVVVGSDGEVLARIDGSLHGGEIWLFDGIGKPILSVGPRRLGLGAPEPLEGGILRTYNAAGHVATVIGARPGGVGVVRTHDAQGNPVVGMGMGDSSRGEGTLTTFDREGTPLVTIRGTPAGRGSLVTLSPEGHELVVLGATTDGDGSLGTYDAAGRALVRIGTRRGGGGSVQVFDPAGSEGSKELRSDR